MFAIHDFCRAVDDIADGHAARLAALGEWRTDVNALLRNAPASRARAHFVRANGIMYRHRLRTVRAPLPMPKIYEAPLEPFLARGFAPPRRRVRVTRGTLPWTVLPYGLLPFGPDLRSTPTRG